MFWALPEFNTKYGHLFNERYALVIDYPEVSVASTLSQRSSVGLPSIHFGPEHTPMTANHCNGPIASSHAHLEDIKGPRASNCSLNFNSSYWSIGGKLMTFCHRMYCITIHHYSTARRSVFHLPTPSNTVCLATPSLRSREPRPPSTGAWSSA